MGWHTTDWWGACDWSSVANVQDFYKAVQERCFGSSPFTLPGAGTDVQACGATNSSDWSSGGWASLQHWIEVNAGSFVRSHNADGTKRPRHYFAGASDFEYWTFAGLMALVNGNANFRRWTGSATTPEPSGSGAYSYGLMQSGDVIGPWIFEDLQKALNLLLWVKRGASYVHGAGDIDYNFTEGIAPSPYGGSSVGAIISGTSSHWNDIANADIAGPITDTRGVTVGSDYRWVKRPIPDEFSSLTWEQLFSMLGGYRHGIVPSNPGLTPQLWTQLDQTYQDDARYWTASECRFNYRAAMTIAGPSSCACDFYAKATNLPQGAGTFNAQGTGLTTLLNSWPAWEAFYTAGGGAAQTAAQLLPNIEPPVWPSGTWGGTVANHYQGFQLGAATCVCMFDVAGGFEYL